MSNKVLHIIGAGLAGSEAAWQAAQMGVHVILHEMRPHVKTPAHHTGNAAELVCSNSFRSDDADHNAVGLLHAEMRLMNSLIIRMGDMAAVPAGGALAVDRDIFSQNVTKALHDHPNITIETGEITHIPDDWAHVIIATGPLTSDPLAAWIKDQTGENALSFFDALAPIVHFESIDMNVAWFQSRYDKAEGIGTGKDYINCPMTKEQYENFISELLNAEYGLFKEWELPSGAPTLAEQEQDTPYFDGCMPIEIMAARGPETLRFGPMKPVGLTNPHVLKQRSDRTTKIGPDDQPYAVVQLRQDNALGTLYNIVGFQTKMKWGEQTRVFRTIPGLENAEFARLGGLHRNTFINSPKLLDKELRLIRHPVGSCEANGEAGLHKRDPQKRSSEAASPMDPRRLSEAAPRRGDDVQVVRFAGQITGCEGYVESASVGLIAGRMAASDILGQNFEIPPLTTAHGALLNHITGGANAETFQPMNVNFGLFPPLTKDEATTQYTAKNGKTKRAKLKGKDRKKAYTSRAMNDLKDWLEKNDETAYLKASPKNAMRLDAAVKAIENTISKTVS